jgi:hypothetical protein
MAYCRQIFGVGNTQGGVVDAEVLRRMKKGCAPAVFSVARPKLRASFGVPSRDESM